MQPQNSNEQSVNIQYRQQQQQVARQQSYQQNIGTMKKDQHSEKQLLRNIGCRKICRYITSSLMRKKLGYAEQCCQSIDLQIKNAKKEQMTQEYQYTFNDLIGLDCEMVQTDDGSQLCRIVIANLERYVLYDKWFGIKQGSHLTDLLTHITGIDQEIYHKNMEHKPSYSSADKQNIQSIIKGKIVVGHDLANDIKLLGIKHQIFIDTVALLPHHLGLPFKNNLKDLSFQYLKKHIHWGAHNPFEDSLCALQIARKHIKQGRGTIQIQPFPQYSYKEPNTISQINIQKIIQHAQLQIDKILLFILRGSRALDIQIQLEMYTSDWDFVVVYDTESQLDGRLIKLPNIDISFFDKNTFHRHLLNNDISYIQIFFVPQKFRFINKIDFPYLQIDITRLRGTLGFHINRSNMKIKRFNKQTNNIKYKWKILKAQHLQIRFMQLFLQINKVYSQVDTNIQEDKQETIQKIKKKLQQTINIKKTNNIWYQIQKQFKEKNNFQELVNKLHKIQGQKMKQVNAICRHTRGLRYKGQKQIGKKNICTKIMIMKEDSSHHIHKSKKQNNAIHNKLQTVQYLQKHSIQQLQNMRIICNRHKFYPNLIQLHYMQSANFSNPISKQCRGLILDADNSFSIVALPYYKFHDYNDPKYSELDKFDWNSAVVYEKKDGSLAFMYYYQGNWHVASSTIPDGTNNYCFAKQQTTKQFSKQFWTIFYSLGFKLPNQEDQSKTFIFQLMSKNHIIVVKRTHSQLCLHGVRDLGTLEQQDHLIYGKKYNWVVATPIQVSKQQLNIQSLVKRVQQLDPLKSEGYVVCDKNWTRLKIKNSSYVRINWLGELNLGYNKDPKKFILVQIILSGQADTFCKYCPQWEHIVKEFQAKIANLNQRVIETYDKIKHLPKKQFAQQLKKQEKTLRALVFAIQANPQKFYGRAQTVLNPKNFYTYISSYK